MLAAAVAVIADVATKIVAVNTLADDSVELGIIDLRLVRNEGVAFGLGDQVPPVTLVALVATLTAALGVAVWRGAMPASIATGLLLGGAIANVGDRAIGGSVIDMFDLGWWPAFNVADISIFTGVALLVESSFRETNDESHSEP